MMTRGDQAEALSSVFAALAALPARLAEVENGIARLEARLADVSHRLPLTAVPIPEAARRLSVSEATIRRRISDGTIHPIRIGGSVRIDLSALKPANDEEIARLAWEARSGRER